MRPTVPIALAALALAALPTAQAQEVAATPDIRVSMANAIRAAEQTTGGGRTVDAELERADGVPVYHVTILGRDGAATLVVDGVTGKVVGTRNEGLITELLEYRPPPVTGERPISLADAVELAETAVQGRAVEAEVERTWRGDRIEVELVRPRGEVEVELSALTGEIIEVED